MDHSPPSHLACQNHPPETGNRPVPPTSASLCEGGWSRWHYDPLQGGRVGIGFPCVRLWVKRKLKEGEFVYIKRMQPKRDEVVAWEGKLKWFIKGVLVLCGTGRVQNFAESVGLWTHVPMLQAT